MFPINILPYLGHLAAEPVGFRLGTPSGGWHASNRPVAVRLVRFGESRPEDLPIVYTWGSVSRQGDPEIRHRIARTSGMAIMLQPNTKTLPEETLVETEQLRAEIHRMADMVSGVVRQTTIDAI